jgi:hypothetical protein
MVRRTITSDSTSQSHGEIETIGDEAWCSRQEERTTSFRVQYRQGKLVLNLDYDMKDTGNLVGSSHTLLFGPCSQIIFMSFLAATMRPACSSRQAAAIQPGAGSGFSSTYQSEAVRQQG